MTRCDVVAESISRLGRWICVDGVEAAGKTTLSVPLAEALDAVQVAEFSSAPFGEALRRAVAENPHFISVSPLGQSLVFLGDFIELYEARVAPALQAGRDVVTDRGWLSKYSYQVAVLQTVMADDAADALVDHVLGFVAVPDLTIRLTAPMDVLRARLLRRDGHCNEARAEFIRRAEAAEVRRLAMRPPFVSLTLETTVSEEEVLSAAVQAVGDLRQ